MPMSAWMSGLAGLALWLVVAYVLGLYTLSSAPRFVAFHVAVAPVLLFLRYLASRRPW